MSPEEKYLIGMCSREKRLSEKVLHINIPLALKGYREVR